MPPQVHLLDVNGPAHIFYEAKEYGANINLHFVSLGDYTEVVSSAGLSFSKLKRFQKFELDKDDYVFIPGISYKLLSSEAFLTECKPFFNWLNIQLTNGAKLCSICTGAFLLAEAGILDGKACTTHWKYFSRFKERFPSVDLQKSRLFTDSHGIYTSAGVASGIDLALYLLENEFGSKFTIDIAKEVVVYFRRSGSDPQLSIFLQFRNHLETRIHDAQDLILNNISMPLSLMDIGERVSMSTRNLTRLFKLTTGITIGAYTEKIRVERATKLLAEGDKVDFVATQCGLKSCNQLRTLLKKHRSVLPFQVSLLK